MRTRTFFLLANCIVIFATSAMAQPKTLTVQIDRPGAQVQPTMWGIFFEDINFAADGGIYAELVKNRSFEFDSPLMGWKEEKMDRFSINRQSGSAMILHDEKINPRNPRYARITISNDKSYELSNEGFYGMGIKKDVRYDFSVLARPVEGNVAMRVELVDDKQNVLGSTTVKPDTREWKKYAGSFVASATFPKARLRLSFVGNGAIDLDMVSLFPADTWKGRPGGLRADLVQLLYELKPGFIRFPGGCIVEGRDLAQRYQWKKTVGKVEDRQVQINRWNTEFKHRPAPDYFQSFGLGFFEYFQLAEDLGAEPLPVLSCGMACQFNTGELVPLDQLDPYIQDALDLIEFANGPATSTWGKLRADMGHPAAFNLKMIGVGNEQWGTQYIERFRVFQKAIKSKYPDVRIVSGSGPFPDGELFEFAWEELKGLNAELVDEHYYRKPEWFLKNASRYDQYDRNGPKIFAGEYAAHTTLPATAGNKNNWESALSEAAFMTGLERNADIVHLASYAPLFAHAEGWQWTPDLIWFDNLMAFATPNYYVQKLFSTNKGTAVLPMLLGDNNVAGQDSLYASAVWDTNAQEVIIKIVNVSGKMQQPQIRFSGGKKFDSEALMTVLTSQPAVFNSFEDPEKIKPEDRAVQLKGRTLTPELAPYSLSVIKVKAR